MLLRLTLQLWRNSGALRLASQHRQRVLRAPGSSLLPFKLELPEPFQGDGGNSFSTWIQRFEVTLNVAPVRPDKCRLLAA